MWAPNLSLLKSDLWRHLLCAVDACIMKLALVILSEAHLFHVQVTIWNGVSKLELALGKNDLPLL